MCVQVQVHITHTIMTQPIYVYDITHDMLRTYTSLPIWSGPIQYKGLIPYNTWRDVHKGKTHVNRQIMSLIQCYSVE